MDFSISILATEERQSAHFFRGLGRSDLANAVEAQRRMIDMADSRIETRIDKLDLEAAIETCLPDRQATLGESSTSWPAPRGRPRPADARGEALAVESGLKDQCPRW